MMHPGRLPARCRLVPAPDHASRVAVRPAIKACALAREAAPTSRPLQPATASRATCSANSNATTPTPALSVHPTAAMCEAECFGNYHRKCQHYVKLYDSGVVKDCNNPHCGLSQAHCHTQGTYTARKCACPRNYTENRRVVNLIQDWCDACREAAWASLDPNNERRW